MADLADGHNMQSATSRDNNIPCGVYGDGVPCGDGNGSIPLCSTRPVDSGGGDVCGVS